MRFRHNGSLILVFFMVMAAGLFHASALRAQSDAAPLRVATKPLEPFVFLEGEVPTGYSIDLWDEITQRLGLEYTWIAYETVSEILDAVQEGDADVAIAGISMTRERETRIDFTHPYFDAGLQILVAQDDTLSARDLLQMIFAPELLTFLGLAILAAMIMAHIILFEERRNDPNYPAGYYSGLWESIWILLGMVANGEHVDKYTRNTTRRVLVIAFWLIGLLLVAQFTATVTSSLTVQQLNSSIQGPGDLPGRRIATVTGSTAADYLRVRGISFQGLDAIEEAYPLLLDGKVDAIVYDAPVLRYYAVSEGRGKTEVVGAIFNAEKYGIALEQGSALREPINEVLLEMYQDGTLDTIYDRWFGE